MGKWLWYVFAVVFVGLGLTYLALAWFGGSLEAKTGVAAAYAILALAWAVARISRSILDRYAGPGRAQDGPEADYREPEPPAP